MTLRIQVTACGWVDVGASGSVSRSSMPAATQLGAPEHLFAFGVLGHDGRQVSGCEFERGLPVVSSKGPTVEAIGDRVVGFAVNALLTGVLRLGVVSRSRLVS
jgi:hypothetical protein